MGNWNLGILDGDLEMDFYTELFHNYNQGGTPAEARKMLDERHFSEHPEARGTAYWLALAHFLWECKAMDDDVLKEVKTIVETDKEKEKFEESYSERKKILEAFLQKIQTPPKQAVRRKKTKLVRSPFQKGQVLRFQHPDKNWGGALVLMGSSRLQEYAPMMLGIADLSQKNPPTSQEVVTAHLIGIAFYSFYAKLVVQEKEALQSMEIIGEESIGKLFRSGWGLFGISGGFDPSNHYTLKKQYLEQMPEYYGLFPKISLRDFAQEDVQDPLLPLARHFQYFQDRGLGKTKQDEEDEMVVKQQFKEWGWSGKSFSEIHSSQQYNALKQSIARYSFWIDHQHPFDRVKQWVTHCLEQL